MFPPPPLYWTLRARQGGELLPPGGRVKGNIVGGVSPPFHLDAVFASCLSFIVEISNIINIEI